MPTHNDPVLAIRFAGYVPSTFEVMTAPYLKDYNSRPWRDISGEGVGSSGEEILGWRPMPEWFQAPANAA